MKQQPWKSGNVQPQARLTDDLIDTTIYFVQRIRRVFFVREAVSRVVNEVFVELVMAFCVLSTSYVFLVATHVFRCWDLASSHETGMMTWMFKASTKIRSKMYQKQVEV